MLPPDRSSLSYPLRSSSEPLLQDVAGERLRMTLLLVNFTGFLAGYFVMFNHWIQLAWFGLTLAAWGMMGNATDLMEGLKKDRWMGALVLLTLGLMIRSSVVYSPDLHLKELSLGWLGGGLLLAFLMVTWKCASLGRRTSRIVGLPVVASACFAAVGSVAIYYLWHPSGVFGMRLLNWFVYGGLNSVCTGLMFGFASMWAAVAWSQAKTSRERWLWLSLQLPLLAATFLTLSRGALLALAVSHAALFLILGWRRAWRACGLFLIAVMTFQLSAPYLCELAAADKSERMGIEDVKKAAALLGDGVIYSDPLNSMVERADTKRFLIYDSVVSNMNDWQDWVWGNGLWESTESWSCSLGWIPEHMHSPFIHVLYGGGVLGLAALLGLLAVGFWRAYQIGKLGEPVWFILAAFGVGGMLFDGESLFTLLSQPRYEPLILWVPLVLASARWVQLTSRSNRSRGDEEEETDLA